MEAPVVILAIIHSIYYTYNNILIPVLYCPRKYFCSNSLLKCRISLLVLTSSIVYRSSL